MQIKYGCTYWGSDHISPKAFVEQTVNAGFDGIEVFLQPAEKATAEFLESIAAMREIKPDSTVATPLAV